MNRRKILIGVGVVVVVGAAALVWLGRNLDSLIHRGIERYGSRITATEVRLSGVDFAVRDGRGTFDDLRIANPEGFSRESAVRFGEIVLDVDPGSLRSEPIVIETISVSAPALRLEITESGSVNLRTLQENVRAYAAARDGGEGTGGEEPPRVAVETLSIQGGTITLDATAVGGDRTERSLGGFTMTDIGGTDGVPADQLGREVLAALLRRALEEGALDELKRRAGDLIEEQAGDLLEGLSGE